MRASAGGAGPLHNGRDADTVLQDPDERVAGRGDVMPACNRLASLVLCQKRSPIKLHCTKGSDNPVLAKVEMDPSKIGKVLSMRRAAPSPKPELIR